MLNEIAQKHGVAAYADAKKGHIRSLETLTSPFSTEELQSSSDAQNWPNVLFLRP